jgi:NADH-quinone oxidoreductase subunit K
MGLGAYVAVSAALFVLGIVCIVSRRNVIYVLMGIEMILNAANINFVAFARYGGGSGLDGQMMAIFVIILAAAEAAVALAIVLNVFHLFESVKPSTADMLRE